MVSEGLVLRCFFFRSARLFVLKYSIILVMWWRIIKQKTTTASPVPAPEEAELSEYFLRLNH